MSTKIQVEIQKQQAVSDLKEIQKGVEGVGAAAEQASEKTADVGGGSGVEAAVGGFNKVAIAVGAITAAIGAAKAAVELFADVVKTAAENGDADSQRLVKAFESIGTAWEDTKRRVAETSLFQNLTSGATSFNKELATTVSTLGHLAVQMEARKLGLDPEAWDAAVQKQIELNNGRRQMVNVTEMLADVEKTRRRNAANEEFKELKSVEDVTAAIQAEEQAIKSKTKTELADGTAIEHSKERLISLEGRLKQVKQEVRQATKDAAKEELDIAKENEEFKKQIIKDKQEQAKKEKKDSDELAEFQKEQWKDLRDFNRRTGKDIDDKRAQEQEQAAREAAERDGRLIDELKTQETDAVRERAEAFFRAEDLRKQAADAATKEEAKQFDEAADRAEQAYDKAARAAERASERRIKAEKAAAAEEQKKYEKSVNELKDDVAPAAQEIAQKAADPQAVARRLADDARKKEAEDRAKDDQQILEEEGEAALRRDQLKDRQASQAAGRKAYNQAQNQFAGRGPQGDNAPFSQSDISGAIRQNTDQIVTDIARQGGLSREMMDALSQMAQGYGQQSNELQQIQGDLQVLKQQVNGVTQQGQRRQSQAKSNRP